MAARCATCCPAQMMKEKKALSPLLRTLPIYRIPGFTEGRRMGASARTGRKLRQTSRTIWPKFHRGRELLHLLPLRSPCLMEYRGPQKAGTATQLTQVGDVRQCEKPMRPDTWGKSFPWGTRRSPHRRNSRQRPRPLAQNHWGDYFDYRSGAPLVRL